MTTDLWQSLVILVLAGLGAHSYMVAVNAFDAAQDALRALRMQGIVCLQCNNPVVGRWDRCCSDTCGKARTEARKRMYGGGR